jgi:hypothetical protein
MPQESTPKAALIVEDPLIRKLVGGILKREGFAVVEAEVDEALRTLRAVPGAFSLLVTNVPAHFLEFAETLPLIYDAAFPDPALAARFRRCRTLRKPFHPDELAACAAELAKPEQG